MIHFFLFVTDGWDVKLKCQKGGGWRRKMPRILNPREIGTSVPGSTGLTGFSPKISIFRVFLVTKIEFIRGLQFIDSLKCRTKLVPNRH